MSPALHKSTGQSLLSYTGWLKEEEGCRPYLPQAEEGGKLISVICDSVCVGEEAGVNASNLLMENRHGGVKKLVHGDLGRVEGRREAKRAAQLIPLLHCSYHCASWLVQQLQKVTSVP